MTVNLPEPLYDRLRDRAAKVGRSVESLVEDAVEAAYPPEPNTAKRLTGPLITGGERGPLFPSDQNPHDLILP